MAKNYRKHSDLPIITHEEACAVFNYDPDTGVISWAVDRYTGGTGNHLRMRAGEQAGTEHPKGYRYISHAHRHYLTHRLAWFIVHGQWPSRWLDHIDGDKRNNRLANLREASRPENQRNRGANRNNTTGFKGVRLDKRAKFNRFQARITVDNKVLWLGAYPTAEAAHAAYCEAAARYHGEFANTGGSRGR